MHHDDAHKSEILNKKKENTGIKKNLATNANNSHLNMVSGMSPQVDNMEIGCDKNCCEREW